VVAYLAPQVTYAPESRPRDRLIELLHQIAISPGELIEPALDTAWAHRLASYWVARNRFIEAGRAVHASASVHEMLEQVQEPLLAILRISADFRPAYDPLNRMAAALAPTDAPRARALKSDLTSILEAGSSSMLH
jgi:spermidine synthase